MEEERIDSLLEEVRLEILGSKEDTSKDDILTLKLKQANTIGLRLAYPFLKGEELPSEMPTQYDDWLVMAAVELYRGIGDENIKSYAENGLSYTRGTAALLSDELSTLVIPLGKVMTMEQKVEEESEENESELP